MRKDILLKKISEVVDDTSGIVLEASDYDRNFIELGLDSLILTQLAITCKKEFNIPITFRQLNEQFGTPELLAKHLDQNLPSGLYVPVQAQASAPVSAVPDATASPLIEQGASTFDNGDTALNLIAEQLQLLGRQVASLKKNGNAPRELPVTPVKVEKVTPVTHE